MTIVIALKWSGSWNLKQSWSASRSAPFDIVSTSSTMTGLLALLGSSTFAEAMSALHSMGMIILDSPLRYSSQVVGSVISNDIESPTPSPGLTNRPRERSSSASSN